MSASTLGPQRFTRVVEKTVTAPGVGTLGGMQHGVLLHVCAALCSSDDKRCVRGGLGSGAPAYSSTWQAGASNLKQDFI
jgi:hypothetical protein